MTSVASLITGMPLLLAASMGATDADASWARLSQWERLGPADKSIVVVLATLAIIAVVVLLWRKEIPAAVSDLPNIVAGIPDAVCNSLPTPLDYTHDAREMIERYGEWKVVGLKVRRAPVFAALSAAVEAVSGGTFNRALRENAQDSVFHLGILVELESPASTSDGGPVVTREAELLVEKLEVIYIAWPAALSECMELKRVRLAPEAPETTTLRQFLGRAQAAVTARGRNFFEYDAFLGSNCQDLVLALLQANAAHLGIVNMDAVCAFVKQDIEGVIRQMPPHVIRIARAMTDIGAAFSSTVDEGKHRLKKGAQEVERALDEGRQQLRKSAQEMERAIDEGRRNLTKGVQQVERVVRSGLRKRA
jgi:hypothetical protein